jgi:hypothetical protein
MILNSDFKNSCENVEYTRVAFQYPVISIRESDNGTHCEKKDNRFLGLLGF